MNGGGSVKRRVVVRIAFGLGNQMLEYAAADKLAGEVGGEVRFDLNEFLISRFFPCQWRRRYLLDGFPSARKVKKLGVVVRWWYLALWVMRKGLGDARFSAIVRRLGIRWIDRWAGRQTEGGDGSSGTLFLSGVPTLLEQLPSRSRLRELFRFDSSAPFPAAAGESVAVHVRRTDFGASALPASFYRQAVAELAARHPGAHAVFFSDDIAWCRREFADIAGAVFVEGDIDSPVEDLRRMSRCRHHVLSNSTFSWWGACLAADGGERVFPPGELGVPRTFPD